MTMAVMGFFLRSSGRWLYGMPGVTRFGKLVIVTALVGGAVANPAGPPLIAAASAADVTVPAGRFEFAPVPEHVFVAGIAETVQLGIRQIDPGNRWRAGDQTLPWRSAVATASGWSE